MTNYTHKATVVAYSTEDGEEIELEVTWEPTMTGQDIEDEGYIPAAYLFVQKIVELAAESAVGPLDVEEEDLSEHRTIN